jgi:hypothetical protein
MLLLRQPVHLHHIQLIYSYWHEQWINNSQNSLKLNLSYKILYTSQCTGRSGWCMFWCTLTCLRSLLPCSTNGGIFTFISLLTIKLIPVLLRYGTSVKRLMLCALHNQLRNYNLGKQWSSIPHTYKDRSLRVSFNKCIQQ